MNFAKLFETTARSENDKVAIYFEDQEITFGELDSQTNQFANLLRELEVDEGDRIALFLPNIPEFAIIHFGAMKYGAIPFPINLMFKEGEIKSILEETESTVFVTTGELIEIASFVREMDSIKGIITVGESAGKSKKELELMDTIAQMSSTFDSVPRLSNEVAALVYTTGTTGRPKGVKHSHGNLVANYFACISRMEYTSEDVGLTVAPLFHVSGLNITFTPCLVRGVPQVLVSGWNVEKVLEKIEKHRVTLTFLIPTMAIDMLNVHREKTDEFDTSSLKYTVVGGAPMPQERIDSYEERYGGLLVEGFGMTETTPAAIINPLDESKKAGSIGTPIRDVVEVKIVGPDSGEEVKPGEIGELVLRGETVTPGYFKRPKLNEEVFDEDGWFHTKDVARMDEEGFIYIEDRLDDMIITGGENVYPNEVEQVLYEIPSVDEAAVIGTPHERWGEQVTAIVVRGEKDLKEEDIIRYCKESQKIANYKAPKEVIFVEEIPRTATLKADKAELKEKFARNS